MECKCFHIQAQEPFTARFRVLFRLCPINEILIRVSEAIESLKIAYITIYNKFIVEYVNKLLFIQINCRIFKRGISASQVEEEEEIRESAEETEDEALTRTGQWEMQPIVVAQASQNPPAREYTREALQRT